MSVNSSTTGYNSANLPSKADNQPTMDRSSSSSALAKLRAVITDRVDLSPAAQQIPAQNIGQLSAQDLAMLAEKRRRELEGGGGGGSPAMKSPTQFVLYSFSLINQRLQALYQALMATLNQRALDSISTPREAVSAAMANVYNAMPKPVQNLMLNVMRGFQTMQSELVKNLNNVTKQAQNLSSNFMNLATVSMSALANRFVRLLGFGREEDEVFDVEDQTEKVTEIEEIIIPDFESALFSDNQDNEKNGRNIISHLENFSRWLLGR